MSHEEHNRLMRQGLLVELEAKLARLATRARLCIDSIQERTILAKYPDPLAIDVEPLSIYVEDLAGCIKQAVPIRKRIAELKADLGIEEK